MWVLARVLLLFIFAVVGPAQAEILFPHPSADPTPRPGDTVVAAGEVLVLDLEAKKHYQRLVLRAGAVVMFPDDLVIMTRRSYAPDGIMHPDFLAEFHRRTADGQADFSTRTYCRKNPVARIFVDELVVEPGAGFRPVSLVPMTLDAYQRCGHFGNRGVRLRYHPLCEDAPETCDPKRSYPPRLRPPPGPNAAPKLRQLP